MKKPNYEMLKAMLANNPEFKDKVGPVYLTDPDVDKAIVFERATVNDEWTLIKLKP